ncbi:hypothetical protein HOLleu_21191 [Holothuria leucospilota]|uniref:G-protein coupled receptors family 1 profile domain-containing protein n=1 Tax=Holothuria leucospilota TaxID=206669 RepID=A0A9Q1BW31_HOLLE|nr:hypothetical protein HOLleu_21191 [Holothuria leucospilota]
MFPNHALRATLWLVCLSAMLANLVVIVSRIKAKIPAMRNMFATEVNTNQNAFLVSLAFADFFMGLYLFSIGIADAKFGKDYFLSAFGWREGTWCKVIGSTGFVSNIASILSLTFVSIERFFTISFTFSGIRFGTKVTIGICALIWIISAVMAVTPIILSAFVQGIFGLSDVCLGLPFVTVPEAKETHVTVTYDGYGKLDSVIKNDSNNLQWLYSQIVYIYFTSTCVLIITVFVPFNVAMFHIAIIRSRMVCSGSRGTTKMK